MHQDDEKSISIALPLLPVLGVLFLCLKLAEVITWSWWIVLLPFYFPFAVLAVVIAFLLVIGIIVGTILSCIALVVMIVERFDR